MKLLLFLLAALLMVPAAAQVNGSVLDADGKPLGQVSLALMKDTSVIKLAASKSDGSYSFAVTAPGSYFVKATHVGFAAARSAAFVLFGQPVTVPAIRLEKSASSLQGVTVTARKPMIEVKGDKTILNVEGTINAIGSDALDLLRKSPGVTVDKDDNLSISGKNGVQVFIDGKPSPLAGNDLANYLKTMQSAQIEAIEVITNPSAKYEAAGNAGIINIRLKKDKSMGTNGSANMGYNVSTYARYNGGLSINHRNSRMNIYGNYNYNNMQMESNLHLYRSVADTLFRQQSRILFQNSGHNFKTGMDYTMNKRSSFGMVVSGNFGSPHVNNTSTTPIVSLENSMVDRILVADNQTRMKRNNINYNVNYNFNGSNGSTFSFNADYATHNMNNNQLQPNTYYDAAGVTVLNKVNYQMITPTTIRITSMKFDYESNLGKGKLSVGGKSAFVNTDNDFQRYNVLSTGTQVDYDRSNRFTYKEEIQAGYTSYSQPFKGGMFQVGLRIEETKSEGTSNGFKKNGGTYEATTTGFKRSYIDYFPSASVTLNKNPMKQWSFTYSRRIDRPAYQDLNPFEFKLDEYTFQKGNVALRPQYTNSFGISHTYKYKLNVSLNYSHVKDIFTQLMDTTDKSKSFVSKQNLATQDVLALNVSYPFMYKSFTSFINFNSNYSRYHADFGAGRKIDLDAFGLTLLSQNSYRFGKNKSYTAEMTAMFMAPTVYQGTLRAKAMGGIDLGIQKQIMKGKATVKASVSDVFQSMRFRGTSEFAGQKTALNSSWESRQFKLSFNFRFGNAQVKAAKQKSSSAEDENKRVNGGNGGITPAIGQ